MAGRPLGPFPLIASVTGQTKPAVMNVVKRLGEEGALSPAMMETMATTRCNLAEIAIVTLTTRLVGGGFAPNNAAKAVAALMRSSAPFSKIFPDGDEAAFESKLRSAMAKFPPE